MNTFDTLSKTCRIIVSQLIITVLYCNFGKGSEQFSSCITGGDKAVTVGRKEEMNVSLS